MIGVLMIATAANEVSVGATTAVQDSLDFVCDMHPSKTDVLPGEPVLLVFEFRSLREESVDINFDPGDLSIEIQDASKCVVAKRGRIVKYWGQPVADLHISGKGQGQGSKIILLNQWVSTLLSPGNYTIMCRVQPRQRDKPLVRESSELTCQIEIMERNDKTLDGILRDVFIKYQKAKTYGERDLAARMICFSDSKQAAKYQMTLVRDRSLSLATRNLAVQGLGRVGSEEAADSLAVLCVAPCLESYLHDTAVLMLYDQAWGDTPELLEFVGLLKKMFKRPVRQIAPEPIDVVDDWMGYWYTPPTVRTFRLGPNERVEVPEMPFRSRGQPAHSVISTNSPLGSKKSSATEKDKKGNGIW